ncbi:acyltransferase [Pseudaminobacter sp. 19-2017]|uniref:Acyltransferase n=1 Tax=Pseudaminobacter soli (ex Zhang et al. 2022) TaxID=2831468 RepID=A0A942E3E9_9HYPH|nr:acyltransferase [Pseudaminobacter soli]MBS3652408.1 acyltransferase [Pseudaminobacter soli]
MARIDELEGLRGLLAVWVVFVHLLPAAGIEASNLGVLEPLFGELIRVQIFCIMSGFVIFMMMSRRREPYLPFLSRRFLRIYPVYLFAFVLSVAMSGVAYEALQSADFSGPKNAGRVVVYEASFAQWPEHVLSHLTLLHGIIPRGWLPFGAYTFLGQAWNISTEFQFYIIAPILFWVLHDARFSLKVLFIAGIAAAWYVGMRWPNTAALSYFAIYFLTGIVSYYAWGRSWRDQTYLNKWTIAAAALAVGTVSIAIGIWIFIFGSALYVRDRAGRQDILSKALKLKPMLFFGKISYSLYLLHMIPLYGLMYGLNGLDLPQGVYIALLGFGTFALAMPMSVFATRYVEGAFYQSQRQAPVAVEDTSPKRPAN